MNANWTRIDTRVGGTEAPAQWPPLCDADAGLAVTPCARRDSAIKYLGGFDDLISSPLDQCSRHDRGRLTCGANGPCYRDLVRNGIVRYLNRPLQLFLRPPELGRPRADQSVL